jgi:hypothetical protein
MAELSSADAVVDLGEQRTQAQLEQAHKVFDRALPQLSTQLGDDHMYVTIFAASRAKLPTLDVCGK